ncbi:NADH-ubiquinone oxidoreductase 1 alpha subcomplex subunit 5 [Klebsormidium nitens]|uniref:NADH-ubiquinone oxidoreductase 1 alpha subcomplex subunit 5 n=1 Tax=Klebsormidium nitens TaxID=105231 RepID=A0A1Y1I1B4_KLENI|nr:NADH-ubiquinone oxidoreductase 1 alpha subcomplex subunit 5 [Klebsormidium nitens]|eukprot:GAQ81908.1 NADH-ubiquinone oxidoreductase 1 alpha subcomplex subunit 5 [Klebsormidium nitens]
MFLRRFTGPLLSAAKESTGIVGLDVVPNAREVLIGLYDQTLKVVKDQIPEQAEYRRSVERITNYRLKVCQEEEEHDRIEQRIGCGQVEELIEQANDELELIPVMVESKPWEVPEGYKVEIIEDTEPIPAHIPQHLST